LALFQAVGGVKTARGIRTPGTITATGAFQMNGKSKSGAITRWPTIRMVK
jgi:hypothetical protein